MSTQDLLNIILIIGFLIIVACISFITYFLVQALKTIAKLADSLENTSENIKEKLQMRALTALPALLIALVGRFLKKGR